LRPSPIGNECRRENWASNPACNGSAAAWLPGCGGVAAAALRGRWQCAGSGPAGFGGHAARRRRHHLSNGFTSVGVDCVVQLHFDSPRSNNILHKNGYFICASFVL
jgi:hypothetical protein